MSHDASHLVSNQAAQRLLRRGLERSETQPARETAEREGESQHELTGDEAPPSVHDVRRTPGQPLDETVRTFMEPRFGADFSAVRVHTGPQAARSAQHVRALAYTVGEDIVFGEGRYNPTSVSGQRLLAHELAHVVQQRPSAFQRSATQRPAVSRLQRKEDEAGGVESVQFLEAGWRDINELGIVYQESGANLRKAPNPKADIDLNLPQNSKVFVLRHHPQQRWYAVSVVTGQQGRFGYVADWLIMRNLPDPDAEVVRVESGDTPIDIARKHYASKGFNVWGKDSRYVVNALVWVNAHAKHNFPGEAGIKKQALDDKWFKASATAGTYIWLPGPKFLDAIYEKVAEEGGGTGSITADLWRTVKKAYEYVAYGLAFVGGLLHGFVKSLWDAISGLVKLVVDVLVSIFTANVLTDVKELWQAVSKLTWKDIKEALGAWADKWHAKLESKDPWTAGHAHGYLTGYIMAEAAQLLLTGGALLALKGAMWGSRLGKAVKATRAFQRFAAGLEKAGSAGGKAATLVTEAGETIRASKVFTSLLLAQEWAVKTLKLPVEILMDLTLEGINRLRQLSDATLKRIAKLSTRAKKWLLGCASACDVDLAKIRKTLDDLTDAEIERALAPIDPKKHAPAKTPEPDKPKQSTKPVFRPIPVEDVVKDAMQLLKKRGVKGLPPSEYGTKLHAAVHEVVLEKTGKAATGWVAASEQELAKIVKLRPDNATLTVSEYMAKWGMESRYPKFSDKFLGTRIDKLKPDLYVRSPDGRALVWDVTSQLEKQHLAKTMFYAEVIGRELGGFLRISESYWRSVK